MHPQHLPEHECLNWRPAADALPYWWAFTEDGREGAVEVPTHVLTNDPAMNLRLALAGAELALADDHHAREHVELVEVLGAFSTPFPGDYLCYAQRCHASRALRAFIEYLRRQRRGTPGGRPREAGE